ncbi:MAG: hypothetical protein IJS83_02760 [Acholeplasmatales bacterium]|nr:hypothetical protein [Acholeplasmatales bacterium]
MGFIGVFLLSILFLVFIVGSILAVIGLIVGIILNLIFTKKKKEGKRYGRIWAIIARIQIIFSSICLIPLLILLIVLGINSTRVPNEFQKTDNIIETYSENEIKTSNGIYVPIKLNSTKYWAYYDTDEIVYSYMPSGTFEKYKWNNHITIKNNTGYEFIALNTSPVYEYPIYCNKDNLDSILNYYENNNNWYYEDIKLTDSEQLILNNYKEHISFNQYKDFHGYFNYINLNTDDNIFRLDSIKLAYDDNDILHYYKKDDSIKNNTYEEFTLDEELTNILTKYIKK